MTIRHVHQAEYDYPGAFFPESCTRPIEAPSVGAAVAAQPDDQWYAVTIRTFEEKLFTAADGEEAWVRQGEHRMIGKFVIGRLVHVDDIPDEVDERDASILKTNIRCNSKDGYGVRTRRGNWQIASDYDRVFTVAQLEVEKP